jgi:ABC-2 type transport system permease protein
MPSKALRRGLVGLLVVAAGAFGLWWWLTHRERGPQELTLYGNVDLRQVRLAFNNSERIDAVLAILQCLIYGYVATYDLNDVPYAVLDRDRSAASRDLLARLDGSGVFHRVADLHWAADVATSIDERRALLVLQIEQDFERRLMSGQRADVQVIADGRNSNTAGTALGYVGAIVAAFNADWRATHSLTVGAASPDPAPTVPTAGAGSPDPAPTAAVEVTTRAWYNPNLETRWHMIPSLIGTLTLLQTLLLTAMSVAREREQGTFDQLLVTPFRPAEIMAGKAFPSLLVGMVQATNILLVAQLWFRIPFAGSFLTLYTGLGLFLLAAIGIGLLVSAVAATMQQAMLYSFLVMMPFALLSGLATPLSSMPRALQYVTLVNPLRYAIEIAERVYLEGAGLDGLVPDLWPLAVIALVTLSAASWMFRHRLT